MSYYVVRDLDDRYPTTYGSDYRRTYSGSDAALALAAAKDVLAAEHDLLLTRDGVEIARGYSPDIYYAWRIGVITRLGDSPVDADIYHGTDYIYHVSGRDLSERKVAGRIDAGRFVPA